MTICHTFKITLNILAPFNTAASEPGHWGIDTPVWRDHQGCIALPGTLVHGRLVEELHNWAGSEDKDRLFGDLMARLGQKAGDKNAPARKAITFSDFRLERDGQKSSEVQTRIAKGANGTVEPEMLQVIETVARAGKRLTFKGSACAFCAPADAQKLQRNLQAALALIPQIGGERSVGYGRIESVTVASGVTDTASNDKISITGAAKRINLALTLDRPFLIAEPNPAENLFTGTDIIPGNALKGVFADTAMAMGVALGEWFDKAAFRHAFCANGEQRPRMQPLSLAFARDQLLDVATHKGAVVVNPPPKDGDAGFIAPTFAPDWKDYERACALANGLALRQYFGWGTPGTVLRVRTAIESATRAAAENKLFGYQCVLHEYMKETEGQEEWHPHKWRCVIDLSEVGDENLPHARAALQTVLRHGLIGLGKTKANVKVAACATNTAAPDAGQLSEGRLLYLVLQTPALMTKPGSIGMGADRQALHNAYQSTFQSLSDGTLKLAHFYAQQVLRGGGYQHKRFGVPDAYAPELLTVAGSVFVLRVKNDAAGAKVHLNQWLARGLSIPADWDEKYRCWKTNPYVPQNGFGEVQINYAEHGAWSPSMLKIDFEEFTNLEDSQ